VIDKQKLEHLYLQKKYSAKKIASLLKCSENQVNYWLGKYNFPKRSISDAIYYKKNPKGDPFKFVKPININQAILYGLGVGLYWGEGNKKNKNSVRLGNTDPKVILKFIEFLDKICNINRTKLRFGLQLFSDMKASDALNYWQKHLKARKDQFLKVIVTPSRGVGTYRSKTQYGVLTVYFHNKKLRDLLCGFIENL
jgi:hypothetical protein